MAQRSEEPGIPSDVRRLMGQVVAWRRTLHEHPELGFHETRTAALVARELTRLGLSVKEKIVKTGVTGLLKGNKPGPTVMFRADMDALPVQESTDRPYHSRVKNAMHACGHDGHVAIALGVAELMAGSRDFAGQVLFLFQPAEEGPGGALPMIEEGVLEDPRVDVAVGLHLWNDLPVGQVGVREGPLMACVDAFDIQIQGPGGHGAAPHQTVDPVLTAAHLVLAIQAIRSRRVDPNEPAVVSVCKIHGGDRSNIIPAQVTITGTVRSYSEKLRKMIEGEIRQIAAGICETFGARHQIEWEPGYPVTTNDDGVTGEVRAACTRAIGEAGVVYPQRTMGGEDMSYFLQKVPGCFYFLGSSNKEKGLGNPHHSPTFDFDEEALAYGIQTMRQSLLDLMKARP